MVEIAFWISVFLIAYPYSIYPALLVVLNRLTGRQPHTPEAAFRPSVSILLPVYNEASRIDSKIRNIRELNYPGDRLQIIVVGDACTDDTLERVRVAGGTQLEVTNLAKRAGKAAALNEGLRRATGEIVVFTDAAIMLETDSLARLVAHFHDPAIGCVSGEDYVEGGGSEGLYGRLELLLRREEARAHSIAGASGCFYAQRRELCTPFVSGMAPDFLSVLNVVRAGRRAIAEPGARGSMAATKSQSAEFTRKTRTFLRGITAFFGNIGLANPLAYPVFSFILLSHKLMRWLAPLAMLVCLAAAWSLRAQPLYEFLFWAQVALYGIAVTGVAAPAVAERNAVVRLCAFFVLVNVAALKALGQWLIGMRLEVWQPTRRPQ